MSFNDEDWGEPERITPNRFLAIDVACYAMGWVSSVLEASAEFVDGMQELLGAQANLIRDRDAFAATAGLEIETLTNPTQEDA